MTTYKNIKGIEIKYLSADPPAPTVGQVWYNSTSKVVKGAINGTGAWSSGGNLNTATREFAGLGTQTAALAVGGNVGTAGSSNTDTKKTELYNGTSWTEVNDTNANKNMAGTAGTTSAGLAFGGHPVSTSPFLALNESWDGTNWTEVNDMNGAKSQMAGIGTSTAALSVSGTTPPGTDQVESWNGTSWTEIAEVNTTRANLGGGGTQTAAIVFAGNLQPGVTANTEVWDGSSWTEVNNLNTASYGGGRGTVGTQTSSLCIAGMPNLTKTEFWDGTSWTEVADLAQGRGQSGASGSSNASALSFGGQVPGSTLNNTEEWVLTDFTTKTFDTD